MVKKTIYLDYAAATPMDPTVRKAMEPYFSAEFYNPSASYLAARRVRKSLEQARADVAACLGAHSAEIVFTAGATEANNLAIQGIMCEYPDAEVLVSAIEHESVLEPAGLFKHRIIPVNSDGVVDLLKLEKMITPKVVLVSVGLVNNELGTVQPVAKIAKLLNELSNSRAAKDLPLYLHSDAAQAANYSDLHVSRLGADLMSLNGGKIYGPKQSGVLYVRAGLMLRPLIVGGGQEFNLRSGTENVAGAVGLTTALKMAVAKREEESKRIGNLRNLFIGRLQKAVPDAVINGSSKHSAPHILSVTFPAQDNELLMMQLDEAGIQAATGSACTASSQIPSHVLTAVGFSDEQAHSTLRFSLGRQTNEADIEEVAKTLSKLIS